MRASSFPLFTLITCASLLSTSCATRSGLAFRVAPATPAYLLHGPDSQQTPFPEVLRAYNGFEPGRGWIDLRPLMELHIEDAYYEPGAPRSGLAGFLGTEVAQYEMRSNGGLQLLSVQSMKNRPREQPSVQALISASQQRHRYFRFYYEVLFRKSKNRRGSVLLGASTKTRIDDLASRLLDNPDSVCAANPANCTVFPEACSVSVEMEIVVNGLPRTVIWGSRLADVVDQAHYLEMLRMYRGRPTPVKLQVNDANALLLPLLPGDHVTWR
jgi:hypothetical protein